MAIDVILEEPAWAELGLAELAETSSEAALLHVGLRPEDWEISLLGCNDAKIAQLNADFRGKPVPTNVLSWPSEERAGATGEVPALPAGDPELGDIAIAYETCIKEAENGNKLPQNHVIHLVVHGVLHLLGYDHERDADADLMEGVEIAILERLGVPNPYVL